MTLDDFLNHIEAGGALNTPEIYRLMDEMSDEARRITCDINNSYHSQEELRVLMSRLLGKPVDETFKMFSPFYNRVGRHVFRHHRSGGDNGIITHGHTPQDGRVGADPHVFA